MRLKRIWSPLTPGAEAFQPTSPATLFTVACTFRLFNFFLSSEIARPGVSSDADEIDGGGDYVAAWKINIEVSPSVFIYLYRYLLFARVIISPRQTVIQHQRIIPLTLPLKPRPLLTIQSLLVLVKSLGPPIILVVKEKK